MSRLDAPPVFRPYRAPAGNGTALIEPPLEEVGSLLQANQRSSEEWDLELGGERFDRFRRQARGELVDAAIRYTSVYRDPPTAPRLASPIVMAGHQPQLFHPGVWFKNFVLSRIARAHGATAINLVVDNDLRGSAAVRVPTRRTDGSIRSTAVPVDGPGRSIPFEQHRIVDRALFDSFDERLTAAIAPLVTDPCVGQLWHHARAAADRCQNTGCAVAQARHALEGQMGLQTLELPLSVACRTRSFAGFMLALIGNLPRLHECYNRSVHHYRAAHGIRSRAHPVPDLGESGEWLEAPLWIYGDQNPVRRAAWVRMNAGRLEISDRQTQTLTVTAPPDSAEAADELFGKQSGAFKLRPRALVTTMYARMVLSDLFLHGIGGGKYDQLGDLIVQRFFDIEPPSLMVVSATVMLPDVDPPNDHRVRAIQGRMRDVLFHGESFDGAVALPRELLQRKRQLLSAIPKRGNKKEWHQAIDQVNRQMADHLREEHVGLARQLRDAQESLRQQQLLASREHPFCAFPLDYLTEMFARLG